jgi:hypothetical protein
MLRQLQAKRDFKNKHHPDFKNKQPPLCIERSQLQAVVVVASKLAIANGTKTRERDRR